MLVLLGPVLNGLVKGLNGLVDFGRSFRQSVPIFHGQVDTFLPGQPFLSDVMTIKIPNVHVNFVPERLDWKDSLGCGLAYGVVCRYLHALISLPKPSF